MARPDVPRLRRLLAKFQTAPHSLSAEERRELATGLDEACRLARGSVAAGALARAQLEVRAVVGLAEEN